MRLLNYGVKLVQFECWLGGDYRCARQGNHQHRSSLGAVMNEIGYFKVGDVTLRDAPARDECFKVVYTDAEMHEFGDMSEIARREMIHRHA